MKWLFSNTYLHGRIKYLSPLGDSINDRCEIKLADENRR